MTDSDAKEFVEDKKALYVEGGYEETEAESLAYCDLEEHLAKNLLTITA
ncbi:MAG: hypothetical protein ACYC0N_00635 [Carboxydocellales bacterium]